VGRKGSGREKVKSRHFEIQSRETCAGIAAVAGIRWIREGKRVTDETYIQILRSCTHVSAQMDEERRGVVKHSQGAGRDGIGAGVAGRKTGVVLDAAAEGDVEEVGGGERDGKGCWCC